MQNNINYYCEVSSFIFKCELEKLWKIVTNESYINYFLSFNNYIFYKQEYDRTFNFYEKNSIYRMNIGNDLFFFEVKNIISTDYYCCLSFVGYFSDPKTPKFFYDLNFFYDNDNTRFLSIYYIPKFFKQLWFENDENKRQLYYSYIDKFIELENFNKIYFESMYLKGDSETLRQIIKNSKIFFDSFGEVLTFTRLIMDKGTQIEVKTNENENEKYLLIFNVLDIITLPNKIKIKIKLSNDINSVINNTIIFLELQSIFKNKSILNFRFIFHGEIYDKLNKNIKFILNNIKNKLNSILIKLEKKHKSKSEKKNFINK